MNAVETIMSDVKGAIRKGRGRTPIYSAEQRKEMNRLKSVKWREKNQERSREITRLANQKLREKKAAGVPVDSSQHGPAPKYTDEERREMRRIKSAAWRAKNLEKSRAITRSSMKKSAAERAIAAGRIPGKIGVPKRFTAEQIRAKRKAKTERWNLANKEKFLQRAREREQAKRDGTFISKAKPRLTEEEKALVNRAWAATRRARVRSAGGRYTKDDIIRLMAEQEGKCAICGTAFGDDGYHVDHYVPLSKGGTNDPSNLKLTHPVCNLKKGAKLPIEFTMGEDAA